MLLAIAVSQSEIRHFKTGGKEKKRTLQTLTYLMNVSYQITDLSNSRAFSLFGEGKAGVSDLQQN